MNNSLLNKYKKGFKAIKKVEEIESKRLSIKKKFQQLSSLFSLGIGLGFNLKRDRKEQSLKSNWALLKKYHQKCA
jgi:hypothetical protein